MKREILFRGKRADNGEWVYGYFVFRPSGEHLIYWKPFDGATQNTYHLVVPETVGQFTGLTDKNGKRIFEGDVVAYGNLSARFIIKWDYESAMFKHCHKIHTDRIEIIGNIHDNPKLP